jgi:hypothetical protein
MKKSVRDDKLHVFLCHSREDKDEVRKLFYRLKDEGVDPWLDEEKILPGQDWQGVIKEAVQSCDVIVVCVSSESINKTGYVQKEIKYALDAADEQPEDSIFIIPWRLEDCSIPKRLERWQWVDGFHEKGFDRLMQALRIRANKLGITIKKEIIVELKQLKKALANLKSQQYKFEQSLELHGGVLATPDQSQSSELRAAEIKLIESRIRMIQRELEKR